MTRATLTVAVVLSLVGCKKERPPPPPPPIPNTAFDSTLRTMRAFRDDMCRCTDKACAAAVLERTNTWTKEADKTVANAPKLSGAQQGDLRAVSDAFTACMIKRMAVTDGPAPPPVKPTVPEAASPEVTVDQLLARAREFARATHPQLVIASVDAVYVDAEGKLDEDEGKLTLVLGAMARAADDPRRRTGLPVKAPPVPPTGCQQLVWTRATGWNAEAVGSCIEALPPFPRCPITEIWKRAIAKNAPSDAVAVMQLREEPPRRWIFTIVDEPRKINIQHNLPDDCELTVEKP